MANINNNAVGLAFPMAKTEALKNACKSFGKLFALNKSDDTFIHLTLLLIDFDENHPNFEKAVKGSKKAATITKQKQGAIFTEEVENIINERI